MLSIGFQLRATSENEYQHKKSEVLCLSRNPNQRTLQVSGNTLQQVKNSSTFGWYSRVTEDRTKRWIHGLVKRNRVLHQLHRSSVVIKSEL